MKNVLIALFLLALTLPGVALANDNPVPPAPADEPASYEVLTPAQKAIRLAQCERLAPGLWLGEVEGKVYTQPFTAPPGFPFPFPYLGEVDNQLPTYAQLSIFLTEDGKVLNLANERNGGFDERDKHWYGVYEVRVDKMGACEVRGTVRASQDPALNAEADLFGGDGTVFSWTLKFGRRAAGLGGPLAVNVGTNEGGTSPDIIAGELWKDQSLRLH